MDRVAVVAARRTPAVPECSISTSTLAFDHNFTTTAKGLLLLAEIVSVNMDFKMFSVLSVCNYKILKYYHHSRADIMKFPASKNWLISIVSKGQSFRKKT